MADPRNPAPALDMHKLPPLHCLLALEALGRHLSLAKAAGELRLTASALTQSIALLEDRLGLKLVCALVPRVELTAAGASYFGAVQAFATRLRDGLYARSPLARTQLRISAPQALGRLWLAPRLADFMRCHPRIDLVLTCTEKYEPLASMAASAAGGVDLALRAGGSGSGDDGLITLPLWSDHLVAAAAPALAARADGLSPAELTAQLPLIEHPVASWQRWLAGTDVRGQTLRPVLRCSDLHLAIETAVLGLGIVVAPSRLLAQRIGQRALRRASPHAAPAWPYRVVVSAAQHERPAVRAFLGWLDAHGAQSAPGG